MKQYKDRIEAGKILSYYLKQYTDNPNALVLALPRGGVPVAYEVARKLNLELDVFLVRKIGYPYHEELALGAIASNEYIIFNESLRKQMPYDEKVLDNIIEKEKAELKRREGVYRKNKTPLNLKNKIIILVDDGIATGASLKVAIEAIKDQKPDKLIVAVPVAPPESINEIKSMVDELHCPLVPEYFNAVGLWYENFQQTTDDEVIALLTKKLS